MREARVLAPVDAGVGQPSLGGANEWLNSPPLTADGLRGKVVVVNFCTYTCINWLRSLPYVRAWSEGYRRECPRCLSRDGLADPRAPVPFRVTLDGASPDAAHGSDVDADGSGVLTSPRMYQLIRQEGPIGDRRFEIEFLERDAQAFCFTFG